MVKFLINNPVYKSQLDNMYNPTGSCNVTSQAMGLCWGGVPRTLNGNQLEDELYNFLIDNGYSRHYPYDLARGTNEFRQKYFSDNKTCVVLKTNATWEEIEKHIKSGKPCVVHGWFTNSGHIVTIVGVTDSGWIVNDPYGEWFYWGYDTNKTGEQVEYSKTLINETCGPDGTIWCHFFDNKSPNVYPKIENRYRGLETDIILQKIYKEKLEVYESEIHNHAFLVKQIQIRLKDLGFKPGKTDSIWGNITKMAYFKFCQDYNISPELPITSEISKILIEAKK
jgi:hypothetical protein